MIKAKPSHQKDRIKNIIFYSVLICSYINHSAFAETDTEDGVLSNLVYFQPQIYIPEKAQPCQGIRVSDDRVLTSKACYKKIFHMARQALTIEALNVDSLTIGRIKKLNSQAAASGFLPIKRNADNTIFKPLPLSSGNATRNTDAVVYYLENNDGLVVAKQAISLEELPVANQLTIPLPVSYLPDGALVSQHQRALCTVSGDSCVVISSLLGVLNPTLTLSEKTCIQEVVKTYHFHCGTRTLKYCQVFPTLEATGTCINPLSGEKCDFDSLYIEEEQYPYYVGGGDTVKCTSCYAEYNHEDDPDDRSKKTTCKPKGCMPGCKDKPDNNGKNLIAPIVGGVAGGLVLIGTVAGCLIYKYRHRASYQNL
ncbi:hypothetical protein [Endozoicomonas sp. 2B-B]